MDRQRPDGTWERATDRNGVPLDLPPHRRAVYRFALWGERNAEMIGVVFVAACVVLITFVVRVVLGFNWP